MAHPMIIILPFFIFFTAFPAATFANNKTDLLSLLAFKSAIDLDPNGALASWNQTLHFCKWNGIQCSRRNQGRVVEINLTTQGLVGSLSPHIGNLSLLKSIVLQNNTFHGSIPQELSRLTRLEILDLSNNSFTGPMPRNSSNWPHLVILDLIVNKLTGNIPAQLGDFMPRLEVLGLSGNFELSGHIPPSIGNLSSLRSLSLAHCSLTGEIPESLSQLKKLEFFTIGMNNLTGTIPSALFNMSALDYFYVARNSLRGAIPSTLGLTLPNLTRLHFFENHFTGPVPVSISNCSNLKELDLGFNYFTGPIPRLERLTHLQTFVVSANLIEDDLTTMIPSFTNSTNLVVLEGFGNLITGSLPESISNLSTHLRLLHFFANKIHGKIPSGIGSLPSLEVIIFAENYLEGPIPVAIGKLSKLHLFGMGVNRLTDEIPSSLGNLTSLATLDLSENNLSGNVPSALANCTRLQVFEIGYNNFRGLIPQEIIGLSSISIRFNLSHNAFEGPIPDEVGSLKNLGILDLSYNRLSGKIPLSLSQCISLEELYLEGNLLEGEIPPGMSALMGLQYLDLSQNILSGMIPSFLGRMNLSRLNLSFNRLYGEVPIAGVFKNITSISLDGNEQLCGGVLELKLTPCSSPSKSHQKKFSTLLKILIPVLGVGGVFLLILALFTYRRRSRKSVTPALFIGNQFMRLSYADLLKATGGFAESNLLGAGRFGSVYKGILGDDGQTQVAVKVLNLSVRGASKSFTAECNALKDVRHRNLLNILTVCESIDFQGNDFKALVYEFKVNGSLENWLHRSSEEEGEQNAQNNNLSMMQRLNIAVDIAQAIEYLHSGTESSIVHGDLKPSNILLDHEMTACVGDFGLAKIVPIHENNSSIGVRGTFGYVPPEYGTCDSVSIQGDVYSFGILLLEMFTSIRPTHDMFEDDLNLHNFISAALPDRVMEIVDAHIRAGSDMNNDKMKDCMTSILSIGVSCSKDTPRDRMTMIDVVNELCKMQRWLCS